MSVWTHAPGGMPDQPFDIAVAISTVLRPTLTQAVRSVFAQDYAGSIQILLGIDDPQADRSQIDLLRRECPANMALTVCDPGYRLNPSGGGRGISRYGGAMRSVLSHLAWSRYIAWLDDDNWWDPTHLSSLSRLIEGHVFAWSLRWLVRAGDDRPLAVDRWMSTGPDSGRPGQLLGGLIDTNCLLLDRWQCADSFWRWSRASDRNGRGNDRLVTGVLSRKHKGRASGRATVHYRVEPWREAAVRRMMRIQPMVKDHPRCANLAQLREALAPPLSPRRSMAGRPSPPVPEDGNLAARLSRRGFQNIVDLWTGTGMRSIAFAAAARQSGRSPSILAIDTWLPQPMDDSERGRYAMRRFGQHRAEFERNLQNAGVEDMVWSLAACPLSVGSMLYEFGIRVGLILTSVHKSPIDAILGAWWPSLRPGGLVIADLANGTFPDLVTAAERFTVLNRGRFAWLDTSQRYLVIAKGQPRAARQGAGP